MHPSLPIPGASSATSASPARLTGGHAAFTGDPADTGVILINQALPLPLDWTQQRQVLGFAGTADAPSAIL